MKNTVKYCETDVLSTMDISIRMHNLNIENKIKEIHEQMDTCDDPIVRRLLARKVKRLKSKLL